MSDIPLVQRRKSRSGTRSRACPKKSDMSRYKFYAKKLTSRTEVPKRNPQYVGKKTDMPRYKFHANVEASIPSAPGYVALLPAAAVFTARSVTGAYGSQGQLPCGDVRAVSHLSVVQDLRNVAGDRSFKHV